MKTKEHNTDILVSGAGHAGLTLALLLARAGFGVTLVDPAPIITNENIKPTGRTVALLNSSLNVLRAALGNLNPHDFGTPLQTMRIVDDSGHGRDAMPVEFRAQEIGAPQFGFNIPNAILKNLLCAAVLKTKNITVFDECKVEDFSAQGQKAVIELSNGSIVTANIALGTDGRQSVIRDKAGLPIKRHDYGQMAITCLISHTKPHNNTSTEFHRSGGPFTFVPVEGHKSSVVWAEKTQDAQKFLAMKKQDFEQAIQDRSHGLLGKITLESPPESWPLILLSAHKLVAPRCAIAAEAAHVFSPIGAQGLNLSLRDVATLAEVLVDAARLGEDIGTQNVLLRYEARRTMDMASHVIGIDGLNRAVANDLSFVADLRRLGLRGLNNIPVLKNFVMNQGLNPKMDDGRIVSGRGL